MHVRSLVFGLPFVLACGATPRPVTGSSAPLPPPSAPPRVATAAPFNDSELLYLEEVQGERALAFARAHNRISEEALGKEPGFKALEQRLLAIYASKAKIPAPSVANGSVRNFWTDAEHQRGVWRQTTVAEYKKAEPKWAILLDVDALNRTEHESFVYHGATCLYPRENRCLVRLSRGGGDAEIVREFDVEKREFVKNGFTLPEGKHSVAWKDDDTVYVGTDFGQGSLTRSGYARVMKEWRRGTPLSSAVTIFEAKDTDIRADCYREFDHGNKRDYCARGIDFEHRDLFIRDAGGKFVKLDKPADADAGVWDDQLVLRLRSEWAADGVTYKKGSLLVTRLEEFLAGARRFQVLFEPTETTSLSTWIGTKDHLVTNVLSDVKNRITVFKRAGRGAPWVGAPLEETSGSIRVSAFDEDRSDDVWLWLEDFTVPSSLHLWNTASGKREALKKMPSFFEASDLEVVQHFATSKDGTKVPYFQVAKKGRAAAGPTVIEAYGGFEISLTPGYRSTVGAAWLEPGGTYVLANLRGGGEYGPAWHEAAMKHRRQNAYDDLIAVAEDLVRRGVTTAKQLGAMGGSNGGLLTSVMLTQRPDLFGAIVSRVPLADMQRYHKLLAGASWMGEYGDPDDPEDWAALSKFSPLHNVKKDAAYPPVLYTTSTKDDRVHPAHARKMVAKLEAMGHGPLYYENIEGGHGGAADMTQRAYVDALVYTFLSTRLNSVR